MKLIKHIINLLLLWAIPYVCLFFFWLLTLCQFSYRQTIINGYWVITVSIYCLMVAILYSLNNGSEDDIKFI